MSNYIERQPKVQYVIRSLSESDIELDGDAGAFWSNADGWGSFQAATLFSTKERMSLNLPMSAKLDAEWMLEEEARDLEANRNVSKYIDQGLKDTYGHGQCASLAMAVLEHLKLPCVVFYKTDPSDDSAIHVANAVDGGFLDIYGIVTHADLEKRYGCELRAVYDPKGEDTSIQFEVSMGQWTDDENDPYGARRAWKDCGAEMRRNLQGPSGDFVSDGKVSNYIESSPSRASGHTAYEATEEDVENVLRSNSLAVANANGKSFESMANELHGKLDFDLIEQAALAGDDLDEQTDYANDEIARQLREMGVLEPLKPAYDSPSPGM